MFKFFEGIGLRKKNKMKGMLLYILIYTGLFEGAVRSWGEIGDCWISNIKNKVGLIISWLTVTHDHAGFVQVECK